MKFFPLFAYVSFLIFPLKEDSTHQFSVGDKILLKDTIGQFVFDSVSHHLGYIDSSIQGSRIEKYFKYIGTGQVAITKTIRSGEPSHICYYPAEPIKAGTIYKMVFCIHHPYHEGRRTKVMCFETTNKDRICITFSVNY